MAIFLVASNFLVKYPWAYDGKKLETWWLWLYWVIAWWKCSMEMPRRQCTQLSVSGIVRACMALPAIKQCMVQLGCISVKKHWSNYAALEARSVDCCSNCPASPQSIRSRLYLAADQVGIGSVEEQIWISTSSLTMPARQILPYQWKKDAFIRSVCDSPIGGPR